MELLVIICNHPEQLNSIMEFLAEEGVPGGTILDSEGMGKLIAADAPLLARFGHKLSGVKPHNKTILSVVDSEKAKELMWGLQHRGAHPDERAGIVFSLPISGFASLRHF